MESKTENDSSPVSVPMRIFQIVLVLLLLATVGFVLTQVFARYVMQKNIKGVEELARLTLVWGCFLGSGYALLTRKHMKVDFLLEKMSSRWNFSMKIVNLAVLIIVSFVMIKYGTAFVIKKWTYPDLSITLLFPRSLYYLPVPCLGVIMILHSLKELVITILNTRKGESNQ